MKTIAFILLVSVLVLPSTIGQFGSTGGAEKELLRLEGELTRAILRRDIALLEKVLGEDYTFTDSGGKVSQKADLLKAMKSGDVINETYEVTDLRVRVYGGTGIVTGLSRTKWRAGEVGYTDEDRFTDVFVRLEGGWRLVASQTTRISRQ